MPLLGPDIEVIDHRATIHGHIEQTQPLAVGTPTAARAMPRLDKVKLYPIASIRHRKAIVELMTTKAERLEEFPIARATNRIKGAALAGQIGRKRLKLGTPRARIAYIVRIPNLSE